MSEQNSAPASDVLRTGDKVLVGTTVLTVDDALISSLQAGDRVLGVAATGSLRVLPRDVLTMVDAAVTGAREAFGALTSVSTASIGAFFDTAALLLEDDAVAVAVAEANADDVRRAKSRGRSVTRLELSDKMRTDMVAALRMWRDLPDSSADVVARVDHTGWSVEQWRAPLGVIGFVFEGRPNVFADATGVLRNRNTVVFRIGSDALGTARALMDKVIRPALRSSGLPEGSVQLLDSPEHAAGWALFADARLSLAVARGSGPAVAELGSIAQQSGVPVSLHGTGGAWILVGETADAHRLSLVVEHSLDRKVCNTMNTVCIPRTSAPRLVPVVFDAAVRAAAKRGAEPRVHAAGGAEEYMPSGRSIEVHRADGTRREPQVSIEEYDMLSIEFEWEETPEFHVVLVESMSEAVDLFNRHSPRFVASVVTGDDAESSRAWETLDAPFVGDGFTRWVDGQFALLRPELGLSNWQTGRLFARSGILSGDSAFTLRLRMTQDDPNVHR